MKKTWKRLCTGFLALATVVTAYKRHKVSAQRLADVKGRKRRAYH